MPIARTGSAIVAPGAGMKLVPSGPLAGGSHVKVNVHVRWPPTPVSCTEACVTVLFGIWTHTPPAPWYQKETETNGLLKVDVVPAAVAVSGAAVAPGTVVP